MENQENRQKIKFSLNLPVAIIIAGILIAAAVIFANYDSIFKGGKEMTNKEIGDQVISYIDNNILKGKVKSTLKSVSETNGVWQIKLSIQNQDITAYATKDGKLFFPEGDDLTKINIANKTTGDFLVAAGDVCKDSDKPIVYFFGSEQCEHCKWEQPIFEKVMAKFKDEISVHKNIDSQNDLDILKSFDPEGNIPALIFGCKYSRAGSGENFGADQEEKYLTALACKLTGSKNAEVCAPVSDLVSQITN